MTADPQSRSGPIARIRARRGQYLWLTVEARAEAEAIRLVNEQLERWPRYIELTRANRWNGVLPATMVGTDITPLLSIR